MKKRYAHAKLRVVIDTNVIVSAFVSIEGIPNKILRAWQKDDFTLKTSVRHISELVDVLSRSRIKKIFKIDKLLACATGGKADFLVSGDEDLLVLNGDPKLGNLKIVCPKEFLKIIS